MASISPTQLAPAVSVPSAEAPEPSLISPSLDRLLAGGLSLGLYVICMLFFDRHAIYNEFNPAVGAMSWAMFQLSFICNFPHFMLSYQLLYIDYRRQILRKWRYVLVAIVVPLAMLGGMIYGALAAPGWIVRFIEAMYILAFWHYARQVYGIILFTSAQQSLFFSRVEKTVLQCSLLGVASLGWTFSNSLPMDVHYYGFSYHSLELPHWVVTANYVFWGISTTVWLALLLRRYIQHGDCLPQTAAIAHVSLVTWYLPILVNPMFLFAVPFFHSLQYLWFAVTFRRNKVAAQLEGSTGVERRKKSVWRFWAYLALSVALGAILFQFIPDALDTYRRTPASGPFLFTTLISVFLNLHHYFIDGVVWRRDSDAGKYLLGR